MSSPSFEPTRRAVSAFRLSPLATWLKVLDRKPGLDHYAISNAEKTISGTGTIQRFPAITVAGSMRVPMILHSHVYPLGRGGQFAGFTSTVYWFDIKTGSLVAHCNYSDNKNSAALYDGMGPWDWVVNGATELALAPHPITVDFLGTEQSFSSTWSECRLLMGSMGEGIGQGNAYLTGPAYTIGDTRLDRRVSIDTDGLPGHVRYTWTTRITQGETVTEHPVMFWVNTADSILNKIACSVDVVSVDDQRSHTWVRRPAIWTRIG